MTFVRRRVNNTGDINSKENEFLGDYRPLVAKGIEFIDAYPKEEVIIKSFDNLRLYGRFMKPKTNSNKVIILFHGYRSSAKRDFSLAVKMYIEMGLNVLLVDQRSHGKSEGKLITFGIKESRDVISWIDYVSINKPQITDIIIGGLSMGATTVMLASQNITNKKVKGITADCGFTSPIAIIRKVAYQNFKIKGVIFAPILNFLCKIIGKFDIFSHSTTEALKNSKIPILFIHGKKDNLVPYEMSLENYKSAKGYKDILIVDEADHGMSCLIDSEAAKEKFQNFLEKCFCFR